MGAGFLLLAAASSSSACSSTPANESETGAPAPPPLSPPGQTVETPATPPTGTTPAPIPTLTTVRVHYATSQGAPAALAMRGSAGPLSWDKSLPLAATEPGLYTWSTPEAKTAIELKPLLGDTWSRGPNYRVEPGQAIDIYPHFVQSTGTVEKRYPAFVSQKLPSTRALWVYLPPTYLENTAARFGVLYMHDAQNLFDAQLAFGGNEWMVDEAMNGGAEDGTIRETIIVGVENTAARLEELTPTPDPQHGGGKADSYVSMLIDEIKPLIDKDLRTKPGREETAVMGASLGGLVSAYAGVRRADVFGLVGAMSPSTWWGDKVILGEVSSLSTKPAKPLRVYVDSGDSGANNDDVANTTELAARYRNAGYVDQKNLLHVVKAGAEHNEAYWAARLPAALHFLLGARAN